MYLKAAQDHVRGLPGRAQQIALLRRECCKSLCREAVRHLDGRQSPTAVLDMLPAIMTNMRCAMTRYTFMMQVARVALKKKELEEHEARLKRAVERSQAPAFKRQVRSSHHIPSGFTRPSKCVH